MRYIKSKSVRAVAVIVSAGLIVVFLAAALIGYANDAVLRTESRVSANAWAERLSSFVQPKSVDAFGEAVGLQGKDLVIEHIVDIVDLTDISFYNQSGEQVFRWGDPRNRYGVGHDRLKLDTLLRVQKDGTSVEIDHVFEGSNIQIFSNAIVPVLRDGVYVGAWQMRVNRTEKAEALTKIFRFLAGMLILLTFVLSGALGIVLVNRIRQQEKIEKQAQFLEQYDEATGLQKRKYLDDALDALSNAHEDPHSTDNDGVALYWIDINAFGRINDNFGRAAGDSIIAQVADDIKHVISEGDLAARVGGDQFTILRTGVQNVEQAENFAQKLTDIFQPTHTFKGTEIPVSLSVGVKFNENRSLDADAFLTAAKLAMAGARSRSGTNFCIHSPELEAELLEKQELERDLRVAMKDKSQFQLYYQPQYNLATGALAGYETLLRWQHPVHGKVSPTDFIPMAESAGLICELGNWVLKQACLDAAKLEDDVCVAVNISPLQLEHDDLVARVRETLAETKLQPERLELEVTESFFLANPEKTIETLSAVKAIGVSVSMDDFGTGYSCLSHLWQFPFDKLKIDKSFLDNLIENPKVESIVASTVHLGRMLGMKITAEGVETLEQAEFLKNLNCDYVQGYLFGRPMPFEDALLHRVKQIASEQFRQFALEKEASDPKLRIVASADDSKTAKISTSKESLAG